MLWNFITALGGVISMIFFFINYLCNRISKLDANSLNYLDLMHHCVISREKKSQRLKGA